MTGPTHLAFADAVRSPGTAFADPALAAADPVLGADGLPLAHPGERGVVFQFCAAADDRAWAVKCYRAADAVLTDRYARLAAEVRRGRLPFAVPARFLAGGTRIGAQSYPTAVLDWVEGVPLDRAVRDRAGDPAALHHLFRAWVRLGAGLRAAGAAHGELSHANVLVVPGADPLRLVDYDSFHLPGLPPAADAGHPNYRHPAATAPADRDRFPLLVVAAALRAVAVLGRPVWDRYAVGDNLLFTAADFRDPAASPLVRELAGSGDAVLRTLVEELARACGRAAAEVPWVDHLCPGIAAEVPAARAASSHRPAPRLVDPAVPSKPLWRQLAVPLALVAGMFLVTAGALAGLLSAVFAPHDEVADAPHDPPPRGEPLLPADPPQGGGPTVHVPAGFHRVWVRPGVAKPSAVVLTADGRTVLVHLASPTRVEAFDATTGAPLATLRTPGVPAADLRAWALGPDRVALYGHPLTAPAVWNPRTGDRLPDLLPGALPLAGADGAGPARCELSPDGRFAFVGARGRFNDLEYAPAPYRVVETESGRVVKSGEWGYGAARFTADGGRLLMAEAGGRVRWVRLPGGQTEAEWEYRPVASPEVIEGVSADGSLLVLHVRPGRERQAAAHLADGKTGQLLRRIGYEFTSPARLSADGRWVVGVGFDGPDRKTAAALLADARTGVTLVRTPLGLAPAEVSTVAVGANGRSLVIHDQKRGELGCYELRGDVPPVPPGTRIPPPLAEPPPRRLADSPEDENPFAVRRPPPAFPDPAFPIAPGVPAPPVFPMPGVPAPAFPAPAQPVPGFQPPPAFPAPARPGLPEAPALRARWTTAAPAAIQANALPQTPHYTPDGKTLVLSGGTDGTVLTFDAGTGRAGPVFDGHKGPGGVHWLGVFGEKVVSRGFDARLATWDVKTGRKVDDLRFPELPPPPDGARGHGGITHAVSPTGRYTAAARREAFPPGPGPLRVLDTTTGKVVVSGEWKASIGGHVGFTADETRMFVVDGLGKATWYKLPSGEVEARWDTGQGVMAEFARVHGVSADGTRVLYQGPLPGLPSVTAVADGATGALVARLPTFPYQPNMGVALSPDGRVAAVPVLEPGTATWHTDLLAVDGWRVLGRIAHPDGAQREAAHCRFSPNGKDLAVFFRQARLVAVYPVPGQPAAVPAAAAPPEVGRGPAAGNAPPPRWTAEVPTGNTIAGLTHDAAAGRILVSNPFNLRLAVVDARTGAVVPNDGPLDPAVGTLRSVSAGGRQESVPAGIRQVAVLDAGRPGRVAGFLALPALPVPAGGGTSIEVRLSPDGRYFAAGLRSHDGPAAALPLRVVERATGKELLATDWVAGSVHFVADGSRVLVADHGGGCRWFKLPTGEPGGGFDLPRGNPNRGAEVTSASADGRLLGYSGPPVGPDAAQAAVVDGTTGRVVRAFGREYLYTSPVSLSADGRLAAVMRAPPGFGNEAAVEVVDVATGAAVGRATVTTRNRSVPTFQLTADGAALLVHDYSREQLHWFDLPARPGR